MQVKEVKIGKRTFEVRQLTMEEGYAMIGKTGGEELDIPTMINACVTQNGKPLKPNTLSFQDANTLLPTVLELNSANLDEGKAGND